MDKTVKINLYWEKYYKNPLQKLNLGPEVTRHLQSSLERAITTHDIFVGCVIQAAKDQGSLNCN